MHTSSTINYSVGALKGLQHEIFDLWFFFHESIVPGPWIHMLKYFRKYFRFRGDIHEIRFFS